ncbi:MAG: hybrid sensor histidine kinase/response regulator [Candidatus Marinimicrobia bacterium]|nr:hybrid sensor histidine kinase/response regulator [Candidatus Neomarinimicrobiota bacterium]
MTGGDNGDLHLTILVVDDEPSICSFLKEILTARGHEVEVAHDGSSAYDLLDKHTFDLALVDLTLPDASGYDIIERAKENDPHLVAMIMSGLTIESYGDLKRYGVDEYINKPFSFEDLIYRIGKYERYVRIMRENRQLQESLQRERRKSGFFTAASHQLRSPIAVLKEFALLFREGYGGELTEKQVQYLQAIDDNIGRLLSLLENVENLSKADSGSWVIRLDEEEPVEILERVTNSWRTVLERGNLKFVEQLAGNLPKVKADKWAVDQVLFNLFDNAAKYSPPGGTVTLRCYQQQAGYVTIELENEGEGIPDDMRKIIFEPFARLPEHESAPGLGLGLTIALELARRMGGDLVLSSGHGGGTRFSLNLPIA